MSYEEARQDRRRARKNQRTMMMLQALGLIGGNLARYQDKRDAQDRADKLQALKDQHDIDMLNRRETAMDARSQNQINAQLQIAAMRRTQQGRDYDQSPSKELMLGSSSDDDPVVKDILEKIQEEGSKDGLEANPEYLKALAQDLEVARLRSGLQRSRSGSPKAAVAWQNYAHNMDAAMGGPTKVDPSAGADVGAPGSVPTQPKMPAPINSPAGLGANLSEAFARYMAGDNSMLPILQSVYPNLMPTPGSPQSTLQRPSMPRSLMGIGTQVK